MENIINPVPYLRTTRNFPEEIKQLSVEVNRSYVDIANTVNNRIISTFPTNVPAVTGENYFLFQNKKQQTFRQVYTFTSTTDINIGFKLNTIDGFTHNWGEYTDGTRWFGIIHASNVAIPGQITFYIDVNMASTTSDVIKFIVGAGAPAITKGRIILHWLSNP